MPVTGREGKEGGFDVRWIWWILGLVAIGFWFYAVSTDRLPMIIGWPKEKHHDVPIIRVPPPRSKRPVKERSSAPPRTEGTKAELPMGSGPVAVTKDADVFRFGFWPCRRAAAATLCVGFIMNESGQNASEGVLPSTLKDNLGNEYSFESFKMNGYSCFGRRGGCWPGIGAKDSQNIEFKADGIVPSATALVLYIHLTTQGSQFPLPTPYNNTQAQDFSVTIPIEQP